ncbi:MAG: Rpp14/Pop5 family protein [Candidatus Hodarchaeota archaeon]
MAIKYKERTRHILVRWICPEIIESRALWNEITKRITRLFGEKTSAQIGLHLVLFDPKGEYALLRCSHKNIIHLRASIAAVHEITGKNNERYPILMYVECIFGTIQRAKRYLSESIPILINTASDDEKNLR